NLKGWEKAENEVAELKKKLESAANKNSALEDRVNHLDGALKECVRQLRQARDEQEETIQEAVTKRTREFESLKTRLESRIVELENEAEAAKSEDLSQTIESLARENLILKHELLGRTEELEIRTIERDLSTQAAESASKQHLDSIKKVAKLEAECRKLRVLSKSSDGQSDGGERIDMSCSDSWASALIAELDQFKNEKPVNRSLQPTSSVEIDLMEDFLEMERLASLPEIQDETRKDIPESVTEEIEVLTHRTKEVEEKLEKLQAEKAELESEVTRSKEVENTLRSKLEAVVCEKMELEDKLEKMEAEKAEMQISWDITKDKYEESQVLLREAQAFLQEAEMDLEKIQKELSLANESKSKAESQLISLEAESRKTYEKIESLEEDVRKEKALS
ncbi:PREDICTED: filament-like plant protein 2, partial [Tarenaya hassleriana]|uniref:filament-like plant protein 2 n=1 Tax=Tarenaya hassleriana TaxID=28532 RepID=UPI00053C0839